MTEYPQPMPEGSRGGTPTGFQEVSEADPVPTPAKGVRVRDNSVTTSSGTLTSPRLGQDSLVERLQEQVRMLEIQEGRAEQIVQDKLPGRSQALRLKASLRRGLAQAALPVPGHAASPTFNRILHRL